MGWTLPAKICVVPMRQENNKVGWGQLGCAQRRSIDPEVDPHCCQNMCCANETGQEKKICLIDGRLSMGNLTKMRLCFIAYILPHGDLPMVGHKPSCRGRPMDSWNKIVCSDLLKLGAAHSWYRTGFDRDAWRQLIAPVRT